MMKRKAKRLIFALVEAANDVVLAGLQDGGANVDVIWSRRRGKSNEVMTLEEAEQRLDKAIRAAYFVFTGERIEGDPVEFIQP